MTTVKATDITLSKTNIPDLAIGATETISVTGTTPADTTDSLSSAVSSNSAVATAVIENGKVKITGVSAGSATITVKFGDVTKIISVTVLPDVTYPDMSSVSLTGTSIAPGTGNKIPLVAQTKVTYGNGDPLDEQFTTEAYDPAKHGPATYEVVTTGLHANTKIYEQGAGTVYLGINNDDKDKLITVKVTIGGKSDTAEFWLLPPVSAGTIPVLGTGRKLTVAEADDNSDWIEIATAEGGTYETYHVRTIGIHVM